MKFNRFKLFFILLTILMLSSCLSHTLPEQNFDGDTGVVTDNKPEKETKTVAFIAYNSLGFDDGIEYADEVGITMDIPAQFSSDKALPRTYRVYDDAGEAMYSFITLEFVLRIDKDFIFSADAFSEADDKEISVKNGTTANDHDYFVFTNEDGSFCDAVFYVKLSERHIAKFVCSDTSADIGKIFKAIDTLEVKKTVEGETVYAPDPDPYEPWKPSEDMVLDDIITFHPSEVFTLNSELGLFQYDKCENPSSKKVYMDMPDGWYDEGYLDARFYSASFVKADRSLCHIIYGIYLLPEHISFDENIHFLYYDTSLFNINYTVSKKGKSSNGFDYIIYSGNPDGDYIYVLLSDNTVLRMLGQKTDEITDIINSINYY